MFRTALVSISCVLILSGGPALAKKKGSQDITISDFSPKEESPTFKFDIKQAGIAADPLPTIVTIKNPNGTFGVYSGGRLQADISRLKSMRFSEGACQDLPGPCPPSTPTPTPTPECHGPFCGGGTPIFRGTEMLYINSVDAKLPSYFSTKDLQKVITTRPNFERP